MSSSRSIAAHLLFTSHAVVYVRAECFWDSNELMTSLFVMVLHGCCSAVLVRYTKHARVRCQYQFLSCVTAVMLAIVVVHACPG